MNQQVRLKNVKKSKKSLVRKPNENKEEPQKLDLDKLPESHKLNNASKSSFHNPRAWREFLEVKKEINSLNEKHFISNDSVMNSKAPNFIKSVNLNNILKKKSGSIDSSNAPTVMQALFNETDVRNFGEKKIKIKSSKDLRNLETIKTRRVSKSKGPKKSNKGDKICWDYIESKENIRKYMKKKRKKMIKEDIKGRLFDFKKQIKICHNLRELHKFTRLQTKRVGAFKERSASTQHKPFTDRKTMGL
jgi:hypothetical protein